MGEPPRPADGKTVIAEAPPDNVAVDSLAQTEAVKISAKSLDRDDRMQDHIHSISVILVWAFALGLMLMGFVWIFHLVTPTTWAFLSTEQQRDLDTSLMSALGSTLVTERARKIVKR